MSLVLDICKEPGLKERLGGEDDDDDSVFGDLLWTDDSVHRKTGSPFLAPNALRSATASPFFPDGRLSPAHSRALSPAPSYRIQPLTWRESILQALYRFWVKHKAPILVAFSQFFGALMNLSARVLEFDGEGMHPFQILFFRMSITAVCACIYMYWKKVPDFPLGAREVRGLLVIRGMTGFFGIFPLWMSLMYLPLAEATVISFLAPSVAGYICHLVLKTPFTRKEQIASLIALAGVVLIARPTSLFHTSSRSTESVPAPTDIVTGNNSTTTGFTPVPSVEDASPTERLKGIGIGLIGVLGAGGAFSAIRCIGTRAHPLISVNYFSVWCTVVSMAALTLAPILNIGQPAIRFGLPSSWYQWLLLIALGICGFIMQFMLTSGLGKEKGNRANAMVYTHMLFAAGFDRFVFGHRMGFFSLLGCGLIVGSALWVALSKKEAEGKVEGDVEEAGGAGTRGAGVESVPMLRRDGDPDDDEMPLEEVRQGR